MRHWTPGQKIGHQGELTIVRLDELTPDELAALPAHEPAREAERVNGALVVGHSEMGHQHVVLHPDARLLETLNPLVCRLQLASEARLEHQKDFDTHEAWGLPAGDYVITRQREKSPAGWAMVAD